MIIIREKGALARDLSRLLACVCLVLLGAPVVADQWYVEPQAELRTFHDDNVDLSSLRPISSFGASVIAKIESGRRTENSEIGLRANLLSTRYTDAPDFNETDATLGFTSAYQAGRSRFSLDGDFDYDSTLTSEVSTSGFVQANKRRQRILLNPSWAYQLTPRMRSEVSLNYQGISYEDVDFIPLFDYSFASAGLTLVYALSERAQLFGRTTFDQYDANQIDTQSLSYGVEAGASYLLTERMSLSTFAGLKSTEAETPTVFGLIDESNNTGPIFSFELTRAYEQGQLSLSLNRALLPSGSGTLLDTTGLGVSFDYRLDPRWQFIVSANGYRNRTPGGETSGNDRDYVSLSPGVRHQLTRSFSLDLSYRYRWQEYSLRDGDASSNALYLSLKYTLPQEPIGRWSVLSP